jgi:hypothetical protein
MRIGVLMACISLAVGAIWWLRVAAHSEPVLTVNQLGAQLQGHRSDVIGHTLRVRGTAQALFPSTQWFRLADANGRPGILILFGNADPVLSRLRKLPLFGGLIPPAQQVMYGRVSTYRVRVEMREEPHRSQASEVLVLVDPKTPFRWRPGERIPGFFTYHPLAPSVPTRDQS